MRVLVLGGTQFMGRETVRRLVGREHKVSVLHRRNSHDLGPEVANLQCDRSDLDALARLLGEHDFEAVFDFAYDWEKGTPAAQVAHAAGSCTDSLRRYVFMSSIAAYGSGVGLREDAPLAPDDHPNPYIQHKAGAERALLRMHETTGFPVTIFRPPFVHGPRQVFYREQFFWDRMRAGRPIILPDGGDTPMQRVFAPDVADMCVRSIEVPAAAGEAFNVAHSEKLTQRTYVEALGRAAGIEPRFISVPREAILAAGGQLLGPTIYFGDYLDLPPLTSVTEKAERILGFRATPLDAALRITFQWYLAQPPGMPDYTFEDRLLVSA